MESHSLSSICCREQCGGGQPAVVRERGGPGGPASQPTCGGRRRSGLVRHGGTRTASRRRCGLVRCGGLGRPVAWRPSGSRRCGITVAHLPRERDWGSARGSEGGFVGTREGTGWLAARNGLASREADWIFSGTLPMPQITFKEFHTHLPRSCSHNGPTDPRNKLVQA
jgi:hypothetical protein